MPLIGSTPLLQVFVVVKGDAGLTHLEVVQVKASLALASSM